MKTSSPRLQRSRAFTLLEVMAAVLVLGLLYTVLADAAMDGLRSEGINRRRGEASLLADQRLADLEATLADGVPPPLGHTEDEVPPYRVLVDVEPLDVVALLPPDPNADSKPKEPEFESLLSVDPSGESRVRQATVTVEWDEVGEPYRVTRRTFAFDTTGLEDIFPSSEEATAAGAAGEENPSGGEENPSPDTIRKLLQEKLSQ